MNRGTVGESTRLTYGLGKVAAMELQKQRTERYWASRAGDVEVTEVTPEEAEARSTRKRRARRKTSPEALRARTREPQKISASSDEEIERLVEVLFAEK